MQKIKRDSASIEKMEKKKYDVEGGEGDGKFQAGQKRSLNIGG